MILKKYNSIMEKPESYRNRWALGLSITLSLFIFFGWALFNGYVSLESKGTVAEQKTKNQVAAVAAVEDAPSPIQTTKETLQAAFGEFSDQYKQLKGSIMDVLVPFVTGMEIYERK